jgi:hypothetical protein
MSILDKAKEMVDDAEVTLAARPDQLRRLRRSIE